MRRRTALLCSLALTAVVGAGGCGLPTETSARQLDPSAAPYQVVTRDRPAPPAGSHRVVLYLVHEGALVPAPRRIRQEPSAANVLTALNAGPTDDEKSEGLTSALPLDADATVSSTSAASVTVGLPKPTESITRNDSVLAFGQIVLTLTALPNVSSVQFEQEGQLLQVPRSDGSLSTGALTRLDYRDLVDPS